jgi:1-acyl-sn-glycerol-3-phosphate acyltransferase
MKKFSFLNIYLILKALFYTARTCVRAAIKNIFGSITRSWCDRQLHDWAKLMIKLLKIDLKIVNPHNIEPKIGQPTIIMCNHASLYDIPLSYLVFPKHSIRMLAKKELGNIPIFGTASRAAEFPFIDRKNLKQAIHDLKSLEHLMQSGIVMWIYAEGTRSKDGKLQPLKKGGFITAIQTNATIIPVVIRGAASILASKTATFKLNQKVEIHIGEPIQSNDYSLDNKEELIQKTYQEMLKLSNI